MWEECIKDFINTYNMKFVFVNIMMCMHRGGGENFDLNMSKNFKLNHEIEFIF